MDKLDDSIIGEAVELGVDQFWNSINEYLWRELEGITDELRDEYIEAIAKEAAKQLL